MTAPTAVSIRRALRPHMIDSSQLDRVMAALEPLLTPPTPKPKPKAELSVDFVTVDEIAAELRVNKMTIYRLCRAGTLPSLRIGRSYRVRRGDLDAYLAASAMGEGASQEEADRG